LARKRSRISRVARGCALAAVAFAAVVALALVGIELYLRGPGAGEYLGAAELRGLYENDGAGSIRTVAGYRARVRIEGRMTHVRIDSLGLRGPEVGPKEPGEKRVLALGDSMVFGMGVEDDEAFPAVLAASLARSLGTRVTAGNGGMPGNGTLEQVRDYRRLGPTFRPDAVLACIYLGNDFDDDVFGPKEVVEGFSHGTSAARFVKSSWRARLALRYRLALLVEIYLAERFPSLAIDRSTLGPNAEEAARTAELPPNRVEGLFMDAEPETLGMTHALDRVERALTELRDLARPSPVIAVIVPTWAHVWPGVYEETLRANGLDVAAHAFGRAQQRIAARCAHAHVACVDLTPALRSHSDPKSLYLESDHHFSVEGHRRAAEAIEPVVRRELSTASRPAPR